MSSKEYCKIYESMTEQSKTAMARLFDTGVNMSGIWVRYGATEETVTKILKAERQAEKERTLEKFIKEFMETKFELYETTEDFLKKVAEKIKNEKPSLYEE